MMKSQRIDSVAAFDSGSVWTRRIVCFRPSEQREQCTVPQDQHQPGTAAGGHHPSPAAQHGAMFLASKCLGLVSVNLAKSSIAPPNHTTRAEERARAPG